MTAFVTLLRRELRCRLLLITTGAALGLFVAIAPWLPGMGRHDPADLRAAGALGVALLWALTLGFFEGLGFLARDLGEGRLAFDFRLPASATAIWAARALGALGAAAAGTGLVLLPSGLLGADPGAVNEGLRLSLEGAFLVRWPSPSAVAPLALALVLVFFLAHAAALARATRSFWIAADLVCALVFGTLSLRALAPLDLWGAREELGRALFLLGVIASVALLCASWVQIVRGRCETDRVHRPFSLALIALALLPPLAVAERSSRYLAPDLRALPGAQTREERSPLNRYHSWSTEAKGLSSEWVQVSGYAEGREPIRFRFALEPRSGHSIRLGPASGLFAYASGAAVSADGSTLAWLEAGLERGHYGEARLVWIEPRAVATSEPKSALTWPHTPSAWGLSPDGRSVATYGPQEPRSSGVRLLRVENRDDGRILTAVRISGCRASAPLLFLDETTVRVPCGSPAERPTDPVALDVYDVDLATGTATPLRLARVKWDEPIDLGPDLARRDGRAIRALPAAAREAPPAVELRDVARGLSTTLEPPSGWEVGANLDFASLGSDGRALLAFALEGRRHVLGLYDRDGTLERSLPVPIGGRLRPLGEIGQGQAFLVAASAREPKERGLESRLIFRLPLAGGAEELVARDLDPAFSESSAIPTTVFRRRDGDLVWLDLASGTLRPLLD